MEKVRTNVILPLDLIKSIDKVAGKKRRSDFLTEAAREKLSRIRFSQALAKAFATWKDEEYPFLESEKDLEKFLSGIRKPLRRRLREKHSA